MKITFGATTIADDSAGVWVIDDSYRPSSAATLQEVRAFRASSISIFPRGHGKTQVSFNVLKTHASNAAAAAWLATETALVGTKATLTVIESTASHDLVCGLTAVGTVARSGKTTVMSYSFLGGLFTATPSP